MCFCRMAPSRTLRMAALSFGGTPSGWVTPCRWNGWLARSTTLAIYYTLTDRPFPHAFP